MQEKIIWEQIPIYCAKPGLCIVQLLDDGLLDDDLLGDEVGHGVGVRVEEDGEGGGGTVRLLCGGGLLTGVCIGFHAGAWRVTSKLDLGSGQGSGSSHTRLQDRPWCSNRLSQVMPCRITGCLSGLGLMPDGVISLYLASHSPRLRSGRLRTRLRILLVGWRPGGLGWQALR